MRKYFILVFIIISTSLFPRTIKEIKNSGYIVFAIRNSPSVFWIQNNITNGYHYNLCVLYAQEFGITPVFKIVTLADYFRMDDKFNLQLQKETDVYADSLTGTLLRKMHADFIFQYPISEVIIHKKNITLNSLSNLIIYRTCIANGSSYLETAQRIMQKTGAKLNIIKTSSTDEQVRELLKGTVDYIILDSDKAIFYFSKKTNFAINSSLLSKIEKSMEVGWFVEKDNKTLLDDLNMFLNKIRMDGTVGAIWQETYGISTGDYQLILSFLESDGKKYFKQSMKYCFEKKYEAALKMSLKIKQNNLSSANYDKVYDTIFKDWLKEEALKSNGNIVAIIGKYMKIAPTTTGVGYLLKNYSNAVFQYTTKLESLRDLSLLKEDYQKARLFQDEIMVFYPRNSQEKDKSLKIRNSLTQKEEKLFSENLKLAETVKKVTVISDDEIEKALEKVASDKNQDYELLQVEMEIKSIRSTNKKIVKTESEIHEQKKLLEMKEKEVESFEGKNYFNSAVKFYTQKEYPASLDAFNKVIVLDYRKNEAVVYVQKIKNILRQERAALEKEKQEKFNSFFYNALLLYSKENYQDALEKIAQCLEIFPENPSAKKYHEIISDVLEYEGEKSISEYNQYYLFFQANIAQADAFLEVKNYTAAITIYQKLLTLFPHNEEAKAKMLICSYNLNPEEMKDMLKINFDEGIVFFKINNQRAANSKFTFVKKVNPNFPEIDSWIKKTQFVKPVVIQSNKPSSLNYDLEMKKALSLFQKNKMKEALAVYKKVLKSFPADYKALLFSSRIENQLNLKNKNQVINNKTTPKRELAEKYYLMGKFYYRLKEYQKALDFWTKSYRADDTYYKALIDIKRLKYYLGQDLAQNDKSPNPR